MFKSSLQTRAFKADAFIIKRTVGQGTTAGTHDNLCAHHRIRSVTFLKEDFGVHEDRLGTAAHYLLCLHVLTAAWNTQDFK